MADEWDALLADLDSQEDAEWDAIIQEAQPVRNSPEDLFAAVQAEPGEVSYMGDRSALDAWALPETSAADVGLQAADVAGALAEAPINLALSGAQGLLTGASVAGRALGAQEGQTPLDDAVALLGKGKEFVTEKTRTGEGGLPSDVASVAGQLLPLLTPGGMLGKALSFGSAGGAQTALEAERFRQANPDKISQEDVDAAFAKSFATSALLEPIVGKAGKIAKALPKADKIIGGVLSKLNKATNGRLARGLVAGGVETGEEALENTIKDLIAREHYDETRKLLEGFWKEGGEALPIFIATTFLGVSLPTGAFGEGKTPAADAQATTGATKVTEPGDSQPGLQTEPTPAPEIPQPTKIGEAPEMDDQVYREAYIREKEAGRTEEDAVRIATEEAQASFPIREELRFKEEEGALFPEAFTEPSPEALAPPKEKSAAGKITIGPVRETAEWGDVYEAEMAKGIGDKKARLAADEEMGRRLTEREKKQQLFPKVEEEYRERGEREALAPKEKPLARVMIGKDPDTGDEIWRDIKTAPTFVEIGGKQVPQEPQLLKGESMTRYLKSTITEDDVLSQAQAKTVPAGETTPLTLPEISQGQVVYDEKFGDYVKVKRVNKRSVRVVRTLKGNATVEYTVKADQLRSGTTQTHAFPPPLKELVRYFGKKDAKVPPKSKVPTVKSKDPTMELLDGWLGDRWVAEQAYEIDAANKERQLKAILPAKATKKQQADIAAAMHVYIDTKGRLKEQYAKYGKKLTKEQRRIVEMALSLPKPVQAFADQISKENREFGEIAFDKEIIRNIHDNYTARIWKQDPEPKEKGFKGKLGIRSKFTQRTPRSKARTLESVLEGWAKGKELAITSAINAQLVMRQQVAQVIHDRNVIQVGKKSGLFSTIQKEGWEQVEHPNFTAWRYAGKVGPEHEAGGQNIFITPEGTVMERVPLYADKPLAKRLGNILGRSRLDAETITKYNALVKQTLLFTSLFHHQAFMRSYMFGTPLSGTTFRPVEAYRAGQKAIAEFEPELKQLVHAGLTLGKIQDFDEALVQQENIINKMIDKVPYVRGAKDALVEFRDQQTDFLFRKMGPAYKAQAALLEYRYLTQKYKQALADGEMTNQQIAEVVASVVNDDFGGLNLQKMGRDPTRQHIFRLLALAPDWTESNVRSMVKVFKKRGSLEGKIYRKMWARVFTRAGAATILFNLAMTAWPEDEEDERRSIDERVAYRMRQAWLGGKDPKKPGLKGWRKLRWLAVDITPIYRAVGGEPGYRKYFSILGHFRDPIKFAVDPVTSAQHKSSVLARLPLEAIMGVDWAGRRFTTFAELIGIDDKGEYKTSRKGKYKKGDPKGGRVAGQTVTWDFDAHPISYEQYPSFLINQARGIMPIQAQNMTAWLMGEMDWFTSLTTGLGLMVQTAKEVEE